MAESDAAGPGAAGGPKKRAITTREGILAAIDREWAALTPEERARRKAEAEKADHEAFEEARRAMRPTLEALERSAESARQFAAAAAPWAPAQPFVLDPNGRGEALRELLSQIEPAHRTVDPEEIRAAAADAVKAALSESKKPPKPRGPTVCERLRELHKEDPDFAETAPERALAQRIGKKSAGSLSKSAYWEFTLRPKRAEARARAQLARAGLRSNAATPSKAQARSDNWDQREAVRRMDAEIDGGH